MPFFPCGLNIFVGEMADQVYINIRKIFPMKMLEFKKKKPNNHNGNTFHKKIQYFYANKTIGASFKVIP